jgi:hypothetical protein
MRGSFAAIRKFLLEGEVTHFIEKIQGDISIQSISYPLKPLNECKPALSLAPASNPDSPL